MRVGGAYNEAGASSIAMLILLPTVFLIACENPGGDDSQPGADDSHPHETAPPDLMVSDLAVEFGDLALGDAVSQKITLQNLGGEQLSLDAPAFVGDPMGFTVGGLTQSALGPGQQIEVKVSFDAAVVGDAVATLAFGSNDPDGDVDVALSARVLGADLGFDVASLDFGSSTSDCPPSENVTLRNDGVAPATVTALGVGDDAAVFYVDLHEEENGNLPWVLDPGAARTFSVAFSPSTSDAYTGKLEAFVDTDPSAVASVSLVGTRIDNTVQTDTWTVDGGVVDLIIPVQYAEQYTDVDPLRDNFSDFLDTLESEGVDYHVAIAQAADGCVYGDVPYIDDSMSRDDQLAIIDTQLDGMDVAHGLIVADNASSPENSAVDACNEGLVRDDARLAIMGYTYIGANHPDYGWKSVATDIQARKADPEDVKIHGIVEDLVNHCGMGTHSYWSDAIELTGGAWYSICEDVGTSLQGVAAALAESPKRYTLTGVPLESSIRAWLDGTAVYDWSYDEATNAVVFDDNPPYGELVVTYSIAGDCE